MTATQDQVPLRRSGRGSACIASVIEEVAVSQLFL
jgi:hypothetical protein